MKYFFCLIEKCIIGSTCIFQSYATRIWALTIYVESLVVFASYSSFLIASLTLNYDPVPFKDIRGLHQHKDEFTFYILGQSAHQDAFAVSNL